MPRARLSHFTPNDISRGLHVVNPLIKNIIPLFWYLLPLRAKQLPQHPIDKHTHICSSHNVRNQGTHPYKMPGLLDCVLYREDGENYIITRIVIHNFDKILANIFWVWNLGHEAKRERQREGIEALQVTFCSLLSVTGDKVTNTRMLQNTMCKYITINYIIWLDWYVRYQHNNQICNNV